MTVIQRSIQFKRLKAGANTSSSEKAEPSGGVPAAECKAITDKLRHARPGDILLFKRAVGINRLITWLTRSRYYHVGLYAGEQHVVESRPRGVICRDLCGPDGDRAFDVIPAPQNAGPVALEWAQCQIGAAYDKSDSIVITLNFLFNVRWPWLSRHEPGKFSCGEFVTMAFREAGVALFPEREPQEIVPAHFEPMLPWRHKAG
jgi:hypothetical protein